MARAYTAYDDVTIWKLVAWENSGANLYTTFLFLLSILPDYHIPNFTPFNAKKFNARCHILHITRQGAEEHITGVRSYLISCINHNFTPTSPFVFSSPDPDSDNNTPLIVPSNKYEM